LSACGQHASKIADRGYRMSESTLSIREELTETGKRLILLFEVELRDTIRFMGINYISREGAKVCM